MVAKRHREHKGRSAREFAENDFASRPRRTHLLTITITPTGGMTVRIADASLMVLGFGLVIAGVTPGMTGFVPCCDMSARGCRPRPGWRGWPDQEGAVSCWRCRRSSSSWTARGGERAATVQSRIRSMRSERRVKRWRDPSWEYAAAGRTPSTVSGLGCSPLRDQCLYRGSAAGSSAW